MSAFLRKFLLEDAKSAPRACLAAFGKHPGWNDHIDDLGLDTESLILAKQVIYLEGLSSQIDAGAWEKLDDAGRLEGFDHLFVWQRGANSLLGTMVSSRDGKGRTRYPMILCAQFTGLSLARVLRDMRPLVEQAMQACRDTTSADAVRHIVSDTRQRLRDLAAEAPTPVGPMPSIDPALASLAGQAALGPDNEGLLRILYEIKSQFGVFAPGRAAAAAETTATLDAHLRVPLGFPEGLRALQVWTAFFESQLDPMAPRLVIWPRTGNWLDLVAGQPTGADFFCLRATPRALPCASEVPYELDAPFREAAGAIVAEVGEGRGRPRSVFGTAAGPEKAREKLTTTVANAVIPDRSDRRQWWLLAGAIALLVAIGAIVYVLLQSGDAPAPAATGSAKAAPPAAVEAAPAPRAPAPSPALPEAEPPADSGDLATQIPAAAPIDPAAAWAALCHDYYEWFGGFLASLKDSGRRARWSRDEHLRTRVIQPIDQTHSRLGDLDPRVLAGVQGTLQTLAATPPAALQDPAVANKVVAAHQLVRDVAAQLQAWPRLVRLRESAARLEQAGFGAALAGNSVPAELPLTGNFLAVVERLLEARDEITPAAGLAATTVAELQALRDSGDPALATAADALTAKLAQQQSLPALSEELARARKHVAPALDLVRGGWSDGRIMRDRFLTERGEGWGAGLDLAQVPAKWVQDAGAYATVAATALPLPDGEWQPPVAQAAGMLELLRTGGFGAVADPFAVQLAGLEDERAKLRGAPAVAADLGGLGARADTLRTGLDELNRALATAVAANIDPAAWLERIRATAIDGSPVIAAEWTRRRDALLAPWNPETAKGDLAGFVAVQSRVDRTRAFLAGLASTDRLPQAMAPEAQVDPTITAEMNALVQRRREAVLGRILASAIGPDGAPAAGLEELFAIPDIAAAVAEQASGLAALNELGRALLRMSELLDGGAGWQGELRRIYTEKVAAPLASIVGDDSPNLSSLAAAFASLDALATSSDRAALVDAAGSTRWSWAITAWTRLGELEDWPGNPAELDAELRLAQGLRQRIDSMASAQELGWPPEAVRARHEQIGAELRRRGLKSLSLAADDAALAAALGRMAEFGVAQEDLPPGHRLNLVLLGQRARDWAAMDNAQAVVARDAAIAALRAAGAGRPEVEAVVAALSGVNFAEGAVDLTREGPGGAGWTLDGTADPARLAYLWTGPTGSQHRLEFARVESAAGDGYLGVTEVPVQLFLDWIETAKLWPEVFEAHRLMLEDFADGDPRRGPRTFTVVLPDSQASGLFEIESINWLPRGLNRYPGDGRPEPPVADSPVNYVSVEGARLFCRSLHCRLPTEAEWRAALEATKAVAAPGANLRDARWLRQLEFQKTQRDRYWPDSDIFLPAVRPDGLKLGAEAVPARVEDDGQLWFAGVRPDATTPFSHLVGNVAEFVTDGDAAAVIGASALSPPELAPETAYRVDERDATRGFSDVGIRLAFSVGRLSGALETQRILRAAPLLR